ncbi:MAG: hypothetical protein JSR59_19860 [Proteobacteria bacterium]|nr:hypothetical protein [Pseudomonadota bacterium]
MHTIAILVTTFDRNAKLRRLVAQWLRFIADYRGPNRYLLCVADSNPRNDVVLPAGVSYLVNAGEGFDDNYTGACKALCGSADFVFAMGDDDLPSMFVSPLVLIDAAVESGQADVTLFNHVSYVEHTDIQLGERYYCVGETVNLAVDPLTILGTRLPRYVAILYRGAYLETLMPLLKTFRGSLHAYAVPILLAAVAQRFRFFDYPICFFHQGDKQDGAWEDRSRVDEGLRLFLRNIRPHVSEAHYAQMAAGFERNYFDAASRQAQRLAA